MAVRNFWQPLLFLLFEEIRIASYLVISGLLTFLNFHVHQILNCIWI